MKQPTLPRLSRLPTLKEGIIVALIASFIGSVGYLTLATMFSDSFVVRFLISSFSFFYILYLLSRTEEQTGRVSTVVIWTVVSLATWISWPTMTFFVLIHLSSVWLIRSLYFYSSLLPSLADLLLNIVSVATAIWALHHTDSLFLGIWCFFLIQALFVVIPHRIIKGESRTSHTTAQTKKHTADFRQAYRDAETAVRKLSTN